MAIRIGINGFGRIGRNVLRAALKNDNVEVVAVNHKSRRLPVDQNYAKTLAHVLKFDTIHGTLDAVVSGREDVLTVNGKEIKILAELDPAALPWYDMGVDVVVESTGKFTNADGARAHLEAGAKRVVISAPAKNVMMIVMGVNEHMYEPDRHQVVSNASCTTNCLAPVAKVLHEQFGIVKGLMTTVHAVTNDQQMLDMPHRDLRRGRAGYQSIIPTTTGAARAVAAVLPELQGKLNGFSMRVPTPNVSVVDLVAELNRPATVEQVNEALKAAAGGALKGIMDYCELPLVSCDFNGNPHSAIIDALSTMVIGGNMVKVVAWYDNEWGYSNRVLDLIAYMTAKGL